tara:strand:- start:2725 stop:2949 length:225 start_codon:yes stop_codon:yes gene_type:complete
MDRGASGACADGEMPGTQATTNDDDTLAAEIGEGAKINVSGVVDCRAGTAKQRNDPGRDLAAMGVRCNDKSLGQ